MKIKKIDGSVNVMIQARTLDEHLDECASCYIVLNKEELIKWFKLKEELKRLRDLYEIHHFELTRYVSWMTHLDSDISEGLEDSECITVNRIPEDFLSKLSVKTESGNVILTQYGVYFNTYLKNTTIVNESSELMWDFLKKCLINCDPTSILNINGD